MKKLIFLLLMAFALVGFISAWDAHPPGVNTLEAALTSCGVAWCYTVLLVTVPVNQDVLCVLPAGITALYNNYAMQAVMVTGDQKTPLDTGQTVDYWLRL